MSDEASSVSWLMEARIEILRIVFGLVRFCEEEDRAVKHELRKRVMLQMDRIELGELKGFCDSVFVLWWKKRVNDSVSFDYGSRKIK